MRILFHHRIGSRDGQSVHMDELIDALRRQGHEVRLVGPALGSDFGSSNAMVDRFKRLIPAALFEVLEVAYNLKASLQLYRAVRDYRPDVIYERFSLFQLAGILVGRMTGLPVLLEVNAPLYEERARNDGLRLHWLGRAMQGLIWRRAQHVLPVTGVLGTMIQAYGVPPSRITVIPNGVNLHRFGHVPDTEAAKAALGLSGRIVLGFTGFVRGWNAVHRLIDFAGRHRADLDLHVLVVGDGPARESLQALAAERGITDRLTITGIVARDAVAAYVAAFDVAVLPGLTPYSSPLKLFEYLQAGRAIVAPGTDNIREVLADGGNAVLFDETQEEALEDALLRLCQDATLRQRLGQAAHETIAARSLTWDANADRVVAIAQRLIAQAGKGSERQERQAEKG